MISTVKSLEILPEHNEYGFFQSFLILMYDTISIKQNVVIIVIHT